jgi:hypothetical protein
MPPMPAPRPSTARFSLAIVATLGGAAMFAFVWLIAKWFVNTCPEQGVTLGDTDFITARVILVVATVVWAAIPMLGARAARRIHLSPFGFVFAAGTIVLLGLVATATLSSGAVCLN